MTRDIFDVDMSARRQAQLSRTPPSTPPLQPRNLHALLETPGCSQTPVVSYAVQTQRMFASPQWNANTPTQAKANESRCQAHHTPQPRAPWMSITSPLFPEETPPTQGLRSQAPPAAGGLNSPRTPRTPRRRSPPCKLTVGERSPANADFPPRDGWMAMDWDEPWLPQPPPPLFPSSWFPPSAGDSLLSPCSRGLAGRSSSLYRSPSPCKLQCGRSDESLETLAASQDPNEDRFVREFTDAAPLGKGQFATVFKATNKLDRQSYAVKVVRKSTGAANQDRMNEVYALASVAGNACTCPHLVRYFSSWLEDGDLYIQTELCGGSLRAQLDDRRLNGLVFQQDEIAHVVRHVAAGLAALHELGFAHLDVKPDNILIGQGAVDGEVCYKLGDFGLASAVPTAGGPAPRGSVNEGDCRYLAREVLRGGVLDVTKVDVFALGLVCYEMATNREDGLPANGEGWQRLRDGEIEGPVPALTERLLALTRTMLHPDVEQRPAALEVLRAPAVQRSIEDGVESLRAQLAAARAQVEVSERKAQQLAEALARAAC